MVPVTYTDLLSWPEDGRRYELYDGEVRELSAPFPRHQLAMLELLDKLRSYARSAGGLVLVSPIDIVFDELNVLQPDIVFFTAARRHHVQLDRAIRVPPDVAIEVLSPGTASHDRGRKRRMFERFGVPQYWILDPDLERLEVLALNRGRYVRAAEAGRGDVFQSAQLPGFACQVDSLLPWPATGASA
jgi:Uma2 family endonuclease